jgi:CheY-like chemotaxis protein
MEVVGEAIDGADAIRQFEKLAPDVVAMDVRMPTMDGIEATRRLAALGRPARVLILTTFDLDDYVYEALRAGASGFLLKDRPAEELVAAVRVIAAGEGLLAPSVTRRLIEEFARRAPTASRAELDSSPSASARCSFFMARGSVERGDRSRAVRRRDHREDPRRPRAPQARAPRSRAGRRARIRVRPRAAGRLTVPKVSSSRRTRRFVPGTDGAATRLP